MQLVSCGMRAIVICNSLLKCFSIAQMQKRMISCNAGLFIPVLPDLFLYFTFKRQVWEDVFFFVLETCKLCRSYEYKNYTFYLLCFESVKQLFSLKIKLSNSFKAIWFVEWITLFCSRLMIPKMVLKFWNLCKCSEVQSSPIPSLVIFSLHQVLHHSQGEATPSWIVLFIILANADSSQVPQLS